MLFFGKTSHTKDRRSRIVAEDVLLEGLDRMGNGLKANLALVGSPGGKVEEGGVGAEEGRRRLALQTKEIVFLGSWRFVVVCPRGLTEEQRK